MKQSFVANLKHDLPASIVVFLVAVPLCLGIALASGAPFFSGLIAGIVGGILIGALSNSQLSVSGPAAGLTAIVLAGISQAGSFTIFLSAVVLAGLIQLALGFMKAGSIANYFPGSVIKGMLTGIGIIIILKQIPHALGYRVDSVTAAQDDIGAVNSIATVFSGIHPGVTFITIASLLTLLVWDKPFMKPVRFI